MEPDTNGIKTEPTPEQNPQTHYSTHLLTINGPNARLLIEHPSTLLVPLSHHPQQLHLQHQQQNNLQQEQQQEQFQQQLQLTLPGYQQSLLLKQPSQQIIPANSIGNTESTANPSSISSTPPTLVSHHQRWNESSEARQRRLARNAERMRERRQRESEEEYRKRLARNAEANRQRRQNESEMERAMRLVRNAARQRLRRAMETPEQRSKRLAKLAERMRLYRASETPEQRKQRLTEMAARARQRIANESPDERKERLRKLNEYAKRVREKKIFLKQTGHIQNSLSVVVSSNTSTTNSTNSLSTQQQQMHNAAANTSTSVSGNCSNDHINLNQATQQQQVIGAVVTSSVSEGTTDEHVPEYQHSQQQVTSLTANTIEYYQNMFIAPTALRSGTLLKQEQSMHQAQREQSSRYTQGGQQNTDGVQNLLEANEANSLFAQQLYANENPKAASITAGLNTKLLQAHVPHFSTIANSLEFYQHKYAKKQDLQSINANDNTNNGCGSVGLDLGESKLSIAADQKPKTTQPHIQNPPTSLYNQFSYLASFPSAAAVASTNAGVSNTSVTPESQTTGSASAQTNAYYPVYHTGFQLGIAHNTVPPSFSHIHLANNSSTPGSTTDTGGQVIQPMSGGTYNLLAAAANTAIPPIQQQQILQDFPKMVRGRPKKATNNALYLEHEIQEQLKANSLLEQELNQMLSAPHLTSQRRGRSQQQRNVLLSNITHSHLIPVGTTSGDVKVASQITRRTGSQKYETDEEKRIRLDKMAAHQRAVRASESPDQRAARLQKLSERARQKRALVRATETEEERKDRLARQAEYARTRRLRTNTRRTNRSSIVQLHAKVEVESSRNLCGRSGDGDTGNHKSIPQIKGDNIQEQHQRLGDPQLQHELQQLSNGSQQHETDLGQHSQQRQLQLIQQSTYNKISDKDLSNASINGSNNTSTSATENNDMLKILEPIIVMKTK